MAKDNYTLEAEKIAEKFTQDQNQIKSFGKNIGMLIQDAAANSAGKEMASIAPTDKLAIETLMAKRDFKLNNEQTKQLTTEIAALASNKINEKAGDTVITTAYVKQNLELATEKLAAPEGKEAEKKQGVKKSISKTVKAVASQIGNGMKAALQASGRAVKAIGNKVKGRER